MENIKTKMGFEIVDGKLPIANVIERLLYMRPKEEEFPEFDKTLEDVPHYCVEWGMIKQRYIERRVYDKMINDLKNAL